jgi:TPR repeat protein
MYKNEDSGLAAYEKGDFDSAFNLLSETAVQGLKKSQYIMAFMFLRGEHVDKSILLGMAWLGVAKESGEDEWVELYDNMMSRANPTQQAMIEEKVSQYVSLYGMSRMNLTCKRAQVTGSRRYEMRCIKVGGVDTDPTPVELKP